MYKNGEKGHQFRVRPETWREMSKLRPPGQSWDRFLGELLPYIELIKKGRPQKSGQKTAKGPERARSKGDRK